MQAETAEVVRARLGALLSNLQSLDYLVESLGSALGDRVGWALVTLLEAWKCACRVRLLRLSAPGELLRSFGSEEQERDSLVGAVKRLRAVASPYERRAGVGDSDGGLDDGGGHAMIRAGDLLHVLQPLAYVALLLAQLRGADCLSRGWRRRLPWLAALTIEIAGLQLCSAGVRRLEERGAQHRMSSASIPRALSKGDAQLNALELRHRRGLVLFLLLRPAARAAARRLLEASAARSPAAGSWRHTSLEMMDHLETAIWARYWR